VYLSVATEPFSLTKHPFRKQTWMDISFLLEREDLISIAVSLLCGGVIGFEREYNNKSAGLRTIILICLGSTIITIVSKHGAGSDDRIAANIITGIGFIGAGVIFKDKLSVLGLTTAAVIWTAAGIGMTTGIGYHFLAFCLSLLTVTILSLFGRLERLIGRLAHSKTITFTFRDRAMESVGAVEDVIRRNGMVSKRIMINVVEAKLSVVYLVRGTQKQFAKLDSDLIPVESIVDYY
jgi:putative Mg2+ transporter-C (MgtC) family protein